MRLGPLAIVTDLDQIVDPNEGCIDKVRANRRRRYKTTLGEQLAIESCNTRSNRSSRKHANREFLHGAGYVPHYPKGIPVQWK
jgi:hypothetical protein